MDDLNPPTSGMRSSEAPVLLEKRRMETLLAQSVSVGWTPVSFGEYLSLAVVHNGLSEARRAAEQQFQQNPGNVNYAYELCRFMCFDDPAGGLAWYGKFIRETARSPLAYYWLARLYADMGDHEQSMSILEGVSESASRFPELLNIFVLNSMYAEDLDPQSNLSRLRRMVRQQLGAPAPPVGSVSKRPRYIIGFVCASLNQHAISCFAEPLLRCLDRKRFMVVVFSSTKKLDHYTEALRTVPDLWYDVGALSDDQLLELIRSERVDVLVDLDNHTLSNRLRVFAQRAAPIQMAFYGFNTSTGLEAMDYRLTDFVVDPPGVEGHYTEKLLRTRFCHYAYWNFVDLPPPSAAPIASAGSLTLGSFNSWQKINKGQVMVWSEILKALPESRLNVVGFDDGLARLRLGRWMAEAGINTERVSVEGRLPVIDLRPRVQGVDLALDSWPFGGAVTTAMTLRLGVPLVTATGPRAVCQASASALQDLEFSRYVIPQRHDVVRRVSEFATDLPSLAADRSLAVERFARTLGDGERLAAEVGTLMIRAIERYRKGKPAEHDSL